MESITKNVMRVADALDVSPSTVRDIVVAARRYAQLCERACNENVRSSTIDRAGDRVRTAARARGYTVDLDTDPRGYVVTLSRSPVQGTYTVGVA